MSKDLKVILGIIATLLLIAFFWVIKTILAFILVSGVLALILLPIKNVLKKIRYKNMAFGDASAAALCIVTLGGLIAGFIALFIPLVSEQAEIIANIDRQQVVNSVSILFQNIADKLGLKKNDVNQTEILDQIFKAFNISEISSLFSGFVEFLGNFLIAIFSILFITFFFLKDYKRVISFILDSTPEAQRQKLTKVLTEIKRLLSRYFIGVFTQISGIFLLVFIGLSIFGINYALIIALFAGLINVIPYLGPLLGFLAGIIITITSTLGFEYTPDFWSVILSVVGVFATVQLLDNFVFQPYIFSNSVMAHPLEIFIVILISASLGGILGMIIAIPFYTFIRIIAKTFLSKYALVQNLTKKL